jgi:hypothetical protein
MLTSVNVMHLPAGIRPSVRVSAAEDALGREHPLARAEERVRWLSGQVAAVGILLIGSVAGVLLGAGDLRPIAFVAAGVQVLLLVALSAANAARRERAIDLIAAGRSGLPLAAVQHERTRLADPRRALRLARSLDSLRKEARRAYRERPLHLPLYAPSVIRAVDGDLARIASVLRSCRPDLSAIARIERLLAGGSSPLYEADPRRLRDELRRIQFSL